MNRQIHFFKSKMMRTAKFTLAGTMIFAASNLVAQEEKEGIKDLLEMDLEKMLSIQSEGRGQVGGFGFRLSENVSESSIHGYTTNEFFYFDAPGKVSTFDNHYYNVFIGNKLGDKVFAEIQLEYEHGGEEVTARYAQVDYKISDALVIRSGKFLTPINTFNEYLYPEYINKAISRPYINRELTPTAWGEVGVQARGKIPASEKMSVFYSAYIVNGLQGDEGGGIRGFRNNNRDKKHQHKALGGRLGASISGLELGAGVYNGRYTEDGSKNLFIGAFDAMYNTEKFSIWAEYDIANMQAGDSVIARNGASFLVSYFVTDRIEPVLRYDFINLDSGTPEDDRGRIYIGLNYKLSNTMSLKGGYEIVNDKGANINDNVLSFQLSLGM